jgi:hypothetical protein
VASKILTFLNDGLTEHSLGRAELFFAVWGIKAALVLVAVLCVVLVPKARGCAWVAGSGLPQV